MSKERSRSPSTYRRLRIDLMFSNTWRVSDVMSPFRYSPVSTERAPAGTKTNPLDDRGE
jgi:hypothetical protein